MSSNAERVERIQKPSWLSPLLSVRVVAVCAVGIASLTTLFGPGMGALAWDRYLRCSSNLRDLSAKLVGNQEESQDRYLEETIREHTRLATELLEQIIVYDPNNARVHSRLAGRYLQRFEIETAGQENKMPVEWIRDAAIRSNFESREAMLFWLSRAYGEQAKLLIEAHAHARRAVELGPLQGEAYVYLERLAMLEPKSSQAVETLVDQALLVRPYDGGVLFDAGRHLYMAGASEEAILHWRESLRRPGSHRNKLVAMVAGALPAKKFIDDLQPDRSALELSIRQYQIRNHDEDLRALAEFSLEEARQAELAAEESPHKLAYRWRQTSSILRSIKEYEVASQCAKRAALLSPYDFHVRHELAAALYHAERFAEADPHLRWCLARRPDKKHLQIWLTDATKQRTQVSRYKTASLRRKTSLSTSPPQDGISAGAPSRSTAQGASTRFSETQTR